MTHRRFLRTIRGTKWQKSATTSALTRSLLMLVLATTTTPLQCSPLTPVLPELGLPMLKCMLTSRTTPTIDLVLNIWRYRIPLMPRTPFSSGRTVREQWLWFRPVELLVELFLIRKTLDAPGL